MNKFVIVKNGIARIMDAADGINPADEIAKWHTDDQVQVTSYRSIDPRDIPSEFEFKDAWEDDGANIVVNLEKARGIRKQQIRDAKLSYARVLQNHEDIGEDVSNERAELLAMKSQLEIDAASTPAVLDAIWPSGLPRSGKI